MAEPILVTLQVAAQVLRVAPHRIIHLCEAEVVKPHVVAAGRGHVRRFSPNDLFKLAVAIRLQDAGLQVPALRKAMRIFKLIRKHPVLGETLRAKGTRRTIAELGAAKRPARRLAIDAHVLLHVVFGDESEIRLIAFQAPGLGDPVEPADGYLACSDRAALGEWTVCLTTDLSVLVNRIDVL